jgi:hypothetical protein
MNDLEAACAGRMIASMVPGRVSEFNELVEKYFACERVRAATDAELSRVAGQTSGWERIKAVELLGVLRVRGAEDLLAAMLPGLPPRSAGENVSQSATSEDLFLVVRLYTALLLINRARWEVPTRTAATQFGESWVGRALLAVLAATPAQ